MTVCDLIKVLNRVPDKNITVVFDPDGGFKNNGIKGHDGLKFKIEDVLLGNGIAYIVENEIVGKRAEYLFEDELGC